MQQRVMVEEAIQIIKDSITVIKDVIQLPIEEALGYIVAENVVSEINHPPFDRSPIDGYACHSDDIASATKETPACLKVVSEVDAGDCYPYEVLYGEAVRIMTGGMIPTGCDVCVWQEATNYGEEYVEIYKAYKKNENVCFTGEDFKQGECLIEQGRVLDYVEIGILSAMGINKINVYRKPKVALITTGSETMLPGVALKPGKIYDSNRFLLEARMRQLGICISSISHVQDEPMLMKQELERVSKDADLILTTGGVSVGKKDIMHEALEMVGAKKLFWQVELKPGSPTIYSMYEGKPVISLTGNPFGTITNFELLVRPAIAMLSQIEAMCCKKVKAVSVSNFTKVGKVPRYVRAFYQDGIVKAADGLHSSGVLKGMIGCNAFMVIPAGISLKEQDEVDVILL